MTESRLDTLLELTREPLPADERFVADVMDRVRARDGRHRRTLAKPLALAAAAVLVVAGGVAALVTSTGEPRDAALQTVPEARTSPGIDPSEPPVSPALSDVPPPPPAGRASVRRGDLEWGYGSGRSAYAVDHESGLRLDTQVQRTELDTDVPQRVTLRLTNIGDAPVIVSAPGGCALIAGAYPADAPDESHAWRCASSSDGAPADRFVLEPGEKHVADATMVLADGDWSVVGMCRCTYETTETTPEPAPQPNPLDGLPELGSSGVPLRPSPEQPAETEEKSLVTPPIRVKVS